MFQRIQFEGPEFFFNFLVYPEFVKLIYVSILDLDLVTICKAHARQTKSGKLIK